MLAGSAVASTMPEMSSPSWPDNGHIGADRHDRAGILQDFQQHTFGLAFQIQRGLIRFDFGHDFAAADTYRQLL